MRDRTAFAILGFVLVASIGVGSSLLRSPAAAAAAPPAATFPPAPPPRASASIPPLVIRPAAHPPAPAKGKTLERAAADAFHAGDRRRAATLYGELAAQTPENPAFVTAATLLRRP